MNVQQLVCTYLQLRGELAAAYAAPLHESCRLGHIERISRELAAVEEALEAEQVEDELFAELIAGRPGW